MFTSYIFNFFQSVKSPIHSLDPRVKIICTIFVILSNVMLPDGAWLYFFITWLLIIALTAISRIKPLFILKRSLIAIPFALVAITAIFMSGDKLTEFNLLGTQFVVSLQGIIRFLSILFRTWLSIQAALLLTSTTSFPDIAHGLRHLHIPVILIAILSFMYRYLFVLSEEAERLLQARSARSASLPGSKKPSVLWRAKNAGNMVGQLFLRSYERSDRVYNAMVARGFQGEFLTYNPHHMTTSDWLAFIIFILLIIAIQFAANLSIG